MRTRDHIIAATAAGLLVGVVDGAYAARAAADEDASGFMTVVAAALLVSCVGFLVGLVQAGLAAIAVRAGRYLRVRKWLERHATRDPAAPREPVVRLHAAALAAVLVGAVLVAAMAMLLQRLGTVAEQDVARGVALLALVLGIVGGIVGALALSGLLQPTMRWIDGRVRLPFPPQPALRYLLYVAVPVAAMIVPFAIRHREVLGASATGLWLLVFLAGEGALYYGWQWLRPRRLPRWAVRGVFALWVVGVSVDVLAYERLEGPASAVKHGAVASKSAAFLRTLTDVDRDGFSGLLGGGDCAPFNGSIGPLARDVPDNGIDEDCNGADAERPVGRGDQVTFYGGLTPDQIAKYNVLLIVIDATRADHVNFLGYEQKNTPYLSWLAEESLVFSNAFTQSSATMLSFQSMLIGQNPGSMTWKKGAGRLQADGKHVTLAERLKALGYRTGIVVTDYVEKRLPGLLQGYDVVKDCWLDNKRSPWWRRTSPIVTTLALDFLKEDPDLATSEKPFFLTLYYDDPHHPYVAHKEGFPRFRSRKFARYDNEIAFVDRHIGFLLEYLRYTRPVLDRTIVIVTSDHGEELKEHGGVKHARTCYRESTHVPLLVRIPGLEGQKIDSLVGLVDLVPTLVEVLGIDPPSEPLDGQSLLVPAFAPDEVDPDRPIFCHVLSQKAAQGDFFRASVRVRDRVLMHEILEGTFELYDTKRDKKEKKNLVERPEEAEVVEQLKRVLAGSLTGNLPRVLLTH